MAEVPRSSSGLPMGRTKGGGGGHTPLRHGPPRRGVSLAPRVNMLSLSLKESAVSHRRAGAVAGAAEPVTET